MNSGEEIRNGRRGPESRAANQQRHSAGPRDGSSSTSQSRRGGRGGLNANRSTDNFQNGPKSQSPLPPPDDHVPMPGFNREAVEAMLRQGYDMRAPLYKPETKSQTGKPESPWGVKPGTMANGKDFFLELRKQVSALQQSGGASQGG